MKFKQGLFLLFFQLVIVSFFGQETATKSSSIVLLSTKAEYIVDEEITLEFSSDKDVPFQLYCANSYGSTIIEPIISNQNIKFKIPRFLTKKRGAFSWKTINSEANIYGNITILPQQQPATIETYLGPPSIDAGESDYTMLVVIPTDSLDNPILDNSKVDVKHQFLKSEKKEPILTDKLIGFKNIYSPLKSGRMIISSESYGLNSKEFDINVMPAIATNFKLFVKRNHEYADGNQITTFFTSVIRDKNKNIISDGSYIEFYITNKKGNILKTVGTTINGVAHAKIIHPDFEDNWKVKAFFIGISESDILEINYKKVIENYTVLFKDNNRNIKVGPLKSFMNQIIPDGLSVKLSIYKDNKLIKEFFKESNKGFANFYLDPNIFENDLYKIIIEAAEIKKEFKSFKLW
ncbi:hypothetical protein [Tenacibaculum sp. 1_MG-2023]|uniref:hypothetical protein n=1 Tax=Tenacibaculum sp. 1_MG-2023 TaxID=3062653 RepID=UPI0026E2E5DB|nr:hypothetical protein [Tenacibaculum sp. 1_MG-2023]MDO6599830.1 hypothetical protein [Tenacibaculum sp. 1_MG-2023]